MSRDPFLPDERGWISVNPRLATARRIVVLGLTTIGTLVVVIALAVGDRAELGFAALLIGLVVAGWLWWLIGRQVRAIGYSERADDLLVVSGIVFRRLVLVPYGRMQLVDVRRGPLERYLGLATVQLHTAAATTDATIPGLPPDEAGRLRDQLAALGEQRSAGL
ncbi:MAG: PH domain-containing protein [Actinomycetia bacterium]|nr:PH domain-containing protein [Actinomycetes bacterium]